MQKNNQIFRVSGFFSLTKTEEKRKGQYDRFHIRIIQLYFQFHRGLYFASLLQYILHIESFISNLGWIDLQYEVYNAHFNCSTSFVSVEHLLKRDTRVLCNFETIVICDSTVLYYWGALQCVWIGELGNELLFSYEIL